MKTNFMLPIIIGAVPNPCAQDFQTKSKFIIPLSIPANADCIFPYQTSDLALKRFPFKSNLFSRKELLIEFENAKILHLPFLTTSTISGPLEKIRTTFLIHFNRQTISPFHLFILWLTTSNSSAKSSLVLNNKYNNN